MVLLFEFGSLTFSAASLNQEPSRSYPVVSHDTHERVLDALFLPDQASAFDDFVLRFEPSFAPESQIIIKAPTVISGKSVGVQVVEYSSLSGNIYVKLGAMLAQGAKEDPVEMAKLFQVRKRTIQIPMAQVKQWRSTLTSSINRSMKILEQRAKESEQGTETITIDGTFYELWFNQVASQIHFRLLDQEVSNREVTGVLPIVRWMNALRREIDNRN
jgi:hypothetical protein